MCLSEPQTAVAITRMRTSACPGVGTGTVLIAVASGPGAAFVLTTACMVLGRLGDWGTGRLGEGALFFFPPPPPPPPPPLPFYPPPPRRAPSRGFGPTRCPVPREPCSSLRVRRLRGR